MQLIKYTAMLNNFFLSNFLSASLLLPIAAAFSFTVGGVFMQFSEGLSRFVPSLMVYVTFLLGASLQTLATRHSGITSFYGISRVAKVQNDLLQEDSEICV